MTDVPEAAVDAAMDMIERLGAGGSRTTVKIVLEAAAPHLAAAERERCAQLAEQHHAMTTEPHCNMSRCQEHTPIALFADLLREQP